VPQRQLQRRRLWLIDGSSIRLRPEERKDHIWSYGFVSDRTNDGRVLKSLTIMDEQTRESPAIQVAWHITAFEVIELLAELFLCRGIPDYIRSDNGLELRAMVIRVWLHCLGVATLHIDPGSPWENGYIESFNGAGSGTTW